MIFFSLKYNKGKKHNLHQLLAMGEISSTGNTDHFTLWVSLQIKEAGKGF